MTVSEWSQLEAEYGRKLIHSGLEGARSGREAFLEGKPFAPALSVSLRKGLENAAIGTCIGLLTGLTGGRRKSIGRLLAFGLLGGAAGLGAAVAWQNRRLASSVASGALKNIDRVRDEHWLERHPIDYA